MKRRSNYETTPIKVVILVMTREHFLLLIYFDWFVASFTFSLTTRSGMWYLQYIEVAQVVQNLQICHGQKLHCISRQCQEWERDTSWQASTPEELEWKQLFWYIQQWNPLHWFGGEPLMVWGDIFGGSDRPPHASQSYSATSCFAAPTAATSHQRLLADWCLNPGVEEITNHQSFHWDHAQM